MFLSRLILNPYSWHVKKDLSNCHEMHRTILSMFPEDVNINNGGVRANYDILYRIFPIHRPRAFELLVQSAIKPNWSNLSKKYFLYIQNVKNLEIKNISNVLKVLRKNLIVRFRLMANPTQKVDGHRYPIYGYQNRIDWLNRKGAQHGFNLINVKIKNDIFNNAYVKSIESLKIKQYDVSTLTDVITHNSIKVVGWKKREQSKNQKHQLTFDGVIFDGYLTITDKVKFINGFKKGIGSGKSYGFGLLSIAPS